MHDLNPANRPESAALRAFLMSKLEGDAERVSTIIQELEGELPLCLNQNFSSPYQSIYDLQDVKEIESFRAKIKANPVLKSMDMRMSPSYTEALRLYRHFWESGPQDNPPSFPVTGKEKAASGPAAPPPVTIRNTVFREGEDAEANIPEVYRRRNRELREACIAYFKTRHNGRIVCECCGFEYSRAYDIADEYIEVHHIKPFSQTEGEHEVNAQTDLIPLCANCHRMIHHNMGGKGNCMSPEELKKKYRGKIYEG